MLINLEFQVPRFGVQTMNLTCQNLRHVVVLEVLSPRISGVSGLGLDFEREFFEILN